MIKTLTSTLDELTIDWVTPYLDDREVEAVRQQATAITVEEVSTAGLGRERRGNGNSGDEPKLSM